MPLNILIMYVISCIVSCDFTKIIILYILLTSKSVKVFFIYVNKIYFYLYKRYLDQIRECMFS